MQRSVQLDADVIGLEYFQETRVVGEGSIDWIRILVSHQFIFGLNDTGKENKQWSEQYEGSFTILQYSGEFHHYKWFNFELSKWRR